MLHILIVVRLVELRDTPNRIEKSNSEEFVDVLGYDVDLLTTIVYYLQRDVGIKVDQVKKSYKKSTRKS